MTDHNVARLTGVFGLAVALLLLIEFPFRVALGAPPLIEDAAKYVEYVSKTSGNMLTIMVIDMFMMACVLVFFAGFRHLIRRAQEDHEWIGTLIFGTAITLVAITLVADSMEGGAALDTVGGRADPAAIRALTEGYMLMFGSIGCILIALLSAASGYATMATKVLPRWTGWLSYAVSVLNLAAIPSIYGGTNQAGFYTAAGWGVAIIATFPWLIWVLIVGILMVTRKKQVSKRKS
jgi:hypothetical protein